MKIYLINRSDRVDWDEAAGFVVKAHTAADARDFAQEEHGYEGSFHTAEFRRECLHSDDIQGSNKYAGKTFWTNTENKYVTCVIIGHAPPDAQPPLNPGVILRDYNAG